MKPLRTAVVGAGHLGRFHAKLAAASEAFELVAVCDPCEAARKRVAEEVGATPIADYREVLDQIDAAVVATPTVTHRQIAGHLLERGVHCLVEKPLAPTAAEASELVDLADRHGATLQVGHVERFNPVFDAAGDALRNPKYITATRTSGYTFRSTDIGAVLDIMIHDIDLVLGLVGSPVAEVSAMGVSVLGDHEDMATAQLRFETGCVAQLTASRVSYEMQRTMQVFTPTGFTSLDFATRRATVVRPREDILQRQFNAEEVPADDRPATSAGLFDDLLAKSTEEADAVNAIELELADFASAIRNGATPRVTGAIGRDAVAVAEAVLESIRTHAWDGRKAEQVGPTAMPDPSRSTILFPNDAAGQPNRLAG